MAKKISARDIFTNEDIFKNIRKSAEETIISLGKINAEFKKTATTLKSTIGQTKFDSNKSIKEFILLSEKANKLAQESAKVEALRQKAIQQSAKATQELQKAEQQKERTSQSQIKTTRDQARETERLARESEKASKKANDQASAYKTLERETRALKNQSKELGATLLQMANNGQKGTEAYRRLAEQFKNTTQKAREGDAQLKKLDKQVGDNFRNVGNYESALGGLNTAMGALGIAFGTQQIAGFIKDSVMGFEDANAKLAGVLGTTTATTGKLQAVQRELGRTTSYTAGEVGDLQVELAKLGFVEPQIVKMSEGILKLAGASGTELGRASEVAGGVLRMFGLDASNMNHVVDVMAKSFSTTALDMEKFAESIKYVGPVAKSAGITLEETAGMLGVLANQGIKGSQAGTSLRRILTDMALTGKPAKEALMEVVEGGINITDAFDEVGRTAQTSLLILGNNMDKVGELTETYITADGAVDAMYRTMKDTMGGAWDRLTSAIEGYILDVDDANGASASIRDTFDLLANNMIPILDTLFKIIKAFVIYKTITLSTIVVNKLMASSFMMTIRSVGLLKGAMMGLGAMAQRVGALIKNNIAGIAIFMLAQMYFQYKKIADIEATATTNAEELAKATAEVANKTSIEADEMANLFNALKKTNNGSDDRKKLIDEINGRYGTTLTNLKDEKAFVNDVTSAYGQLMAQLEAKAEMEMIRTKYEVAGRHFAESQVEYDKAIANNMEYSNNTGKGEELLRTLFTHFGVDNADDLDAIQVAFGDLNEKNKAIYEQYKKEYLAMQVKVALRKPTQNVGANGNNNGNNGNNGNNDNDKPNEVQDYEMELQEYEKYVSKRIALDEQLRLLKEKSAFSIKEINLDNEIENIVLQTKNLALAGKDAFADIIDGETFDSYEREIMKLFSLLKDEQVKETDFAIEEIKRKFAEEKLLEEQKIKDNYANLVEKFNKDRAKMVEGVASGKERQGSVTKMDKEKAKIDAEYKSQLEKFSLDNIKRNEDENLEIELAKQNSADAIVVIESDKNEKINDYNEKRNTAYIEGVNERQEVEEEKANSIDKIDSEVEEKNQKELNAIVEASADFFIQQSERKIAQIEKEIEIAQKQFDYYMELAKNGNINAKESLAEQQKIINEGELKKQQEQKRIQMMELAKTAYTTYQGKVNSGSKTPLADTIKDITMLQAFIKTIPAFEDGIEDTGKHGNGVDGKGGFNAILHPNERVIPKSLNEQIGNLSNTQLAKIAVNYRAGKIGDVNQSGSALDLAILVNEIKDLKSVIKNKPETNIELGEITHSIMEVVKSVRKGNEVSYNRFKIRK